MNKICTTIEQSKKLLELGIDRKSSDMYYWCGSDLRIGGYKAQDEELDIPAWSLTALLELIPSVIGLANHEGKYNIKYANEFIIDQKLHDSYIDACYEVVVWLKENNKI